MRAGGRSPLVKGSLPLEAGTTIRWLQGPEATARTPASPLPPAPNGRAPCSSPEPPIQGLLYSTEHPRAEALIHTHLGPGIPELEPAPRKPTINAIIVVVALISLKRKPAPRSGMTQLWPHDAAGRPGAGTLDSWAPFLPQAAHCCPPSPHTPFPLPLPTNMQALLVRIKSHLIV